MARESSRDSRWTRSLRSVARRGPSCLCFGRVRLRGPEGLMPGAVPPAGAQGAPTRVPGATVQPQATTNACDARVVVIANLQPTPDDRLRGIFVPRQLP